MNSWPKHVLMTADTIGGVWTFAMELTSALKKRGVTVTLATTGRRVTPSQRAQAKAAGNPEIFESAFRLEWQEHPWEDVDRTGDWLQNLAARVKPDIVHLNDYSHASRNWDHPTVVTGHSCVLSWFQAARGITAPAEWTEYRRRVEWGLHSADVVTAPSQAMLSCLERHYGQLSQALVIPNGRTARLFYTSPKEPFVFAAGRVWDEGKNIVTLARAAKGLPWPVYVAGEDRDTQLPNVRMLGFLDEECLAGWLSRASIYCLPAKYEPFGLSILEAALSGNALLLGDIESLREVWGHAARFVHPDDEAALRNAAMELIENSTLRTLMAAKARARARRYTAHAMATGYLKAYALAQASAARYSAARYNVSGTVPT